MALLRHQDLGEREDARSSPGQRSPGDRDTADCRGAVGTEKLGVLREEAEGEASPAWDVVSVVRAGGGAAGKPCRLGTCCWFARSRASTRNTAWLRAQSHLTQCRATKGGALGARRPPTAEVTKVAACRAWSRTAAKGRRAHVRAEGQRRLRSTWRAQLFPFFKGRRHQGSASNPRALQGCQCVLRAFQSRCA